PADVDAPEADERTEMALDPGRLRVAAKRLAHGGGELLPGDLGRVRLDDPRVRLDDLAERRIRNARSVRHTPALTPRGRQRPAAELVDEARLAEPGASEERDEPGRAPRR